VSLHAISETRWSAQINAVEPVAKHLSTIRAAVEEVELLNLQPHARTGLQSTKEYFDTFECILLSKIWIEILTLLQQTNLVIEARNATLNVDTKNIDNLVSNIRQDREELEKIFSKSKDIAGNARISTEFQTTAALKHNPTLKIITESTFLF
jgi:hypothetical protein